MTADSKPYVGKSIPDRKAEKREKKTRRGPFSSLGRRIMAINLFSVIFLAGGILYLDQFRDGLIEARFQEWPDDCRCPRRGGAAGSLP